MEIYSNDNPPPALFAIRADLMLAFHSMET